MIPAEALEALRSRVDVVDVVSSYVPSLKRAGRHFKGLCPFHQERTPSFIVSPERQTFHCFGCGEGGDVFSFLMKIENLSFSEAAEKLAETAGMALPKSDAAVGPEEKEKLRMKELFAFAAEAYRQALKTAPQADVARKYLVERKVAPSSAETFSLGYAPGSSHLLRAAKAKGFEEALLLKAGLSVRSKSTGEPRDYFYNRLMFPIRDAKGAVVGFGGRVLGEGEPKYLNSPESPVFSKGRVLYGLFEGLSSSRQLRRVILMEGYMDVIAAHEFGFKNACAPLGTALTPSQAALVKRHATEALVLFDADSPGLAAAIRGAEVLIEAGLNVRIATVPEGKDPDEYLHQKGKENFEGCLEGAVDLVEFKCAQLLKKRAQPLSPSDKAALAKEMLETIARYPDEVQKSEWTRWLAHRLNVSEEALRRSGSGLDSLLRKSSTVNSQRSKESRPDPMPAPKSEALSFFDSQILGVLMRKPALSSMAEASDFASGTARKIFNELRALAPWAEGWPARLLSAFEGAEKGMVSKVLIASSEFEDQDAEAVLSAALARRRDYERLTTIEPMISAMGRKGQVDEALKNEYHELLTRLKGTKR